MRLTLLRRCCCPQNSYFMNDNTASNIAVSLSRSRKCPGMTLVGVLQDQLNAYVMFCGSLDIHAILYAMSSSLARLFGENQKRMG